MRNALCTVEEAAAYIKEKGYNVDAEQWWDYYQSKGWMVGRNNMQDWKAAIRTWERNERKRFTKKRNEPKAFENVKRW